jgi:hypothetical protein
MKRVTHLSVVGFAAVFGLLQADGAAVTTDQRGEPRPAGSGCDVGAFEVQP